MLRVEPLTVSPVNPTCSIYLRQLCRLEASRAGARYNQRKYFQRPNAATEVTMIVQVTTVSVSSAQTRARTRLLRTGDGEEKKARRKTNGVKNNPRFSSQNAARHLFQRGIAGRESGQNSQSRWVAR